MTGAYAELAELAERELELVRGGQFAEAEELRTPRAELVASLPLVPPPAALPLLKAAAAFQRQTEEVLEREMAQTASALHSIRRGRHAVQAYTPAPDPADDRRLIDNAG